MIEDVAGSIELINTQMIGSSIGLIAKDRHPKVEKLSLEET
jgi:hypothetical protein